ncbi:MAG: hypothetical protein K9G05_06235 [Candidatus Nanopelagicales bacterium]|nr:hypothetical protein [Candidatus Nanopelagicales bacterium]MCF8551657.1 hypothetical protein [Candidatus Nanopelagicales bacterium]
MPNGGYPMHLLTPLGDSGVEILTSGWHVSVRRRHEEGFYEFGGLNEIQTSALLYHLLYWMGFDNSELLTPIRHSLTRRGFELRPHFNQHGCIYDY